MARSRFKRCRCGVLLTNGACHDTDAQCIVALYDALQAEKKRFQVKCAEWSRKVLQSVAAALDDAERASRAP